MQDQKIAPKTMFRTILLPLFFSHGAIVSLTIGFYLRVFLDCFHFNSCSYSHHPIPHHLSQVHTSSHNEVPRRGCPLGCPLLFHYCFGAAAEGCIDLTQNRLHDPTIAASKRKGNLYVRLNKATNLADKDLFGSSDPFIEMWLDKNYKQRSKDTKGLNPSFNEIFCFYVLPGQDKLYVKAVDRDPLVNYKIGQATIPLSTRFPKRKGWSPRLHLAKVAWPLQQRRG